MRYLMCAALAAAFCACANTPEGYVAPPDAGGACSGSDCPICDDDGDCPGGRCVDGTCTTPECLHDDWCPEGQRCDHGTCTTPPDGGMCTGNCPVCDGDEDCPADQHCDAGACVPDDPPTCDPACPAGQHCEGTTCVPDDPPTCDPACETGQHCEGTTCVPDDPPPECDGNEDCPDGQVCDGGTCVCDGDDGSDGACGPGKILICHYPPGHPNPPHQKCVGEDSQAAHEAHGDTLGACP